MLLQNNAPCNGWTTKNRACTERCITERTCQISALIGNFSVNKFASIKTSVIYTTLYCLQSVQTLKYFKTLNKKKYIRQVNYSLSYFFINNPVGWTRELIERVGTGSNLVA